MHEARRRSEARWGVLALGLVLAVLAGCEQTIDVRLAIVTDYGPGEFARAVYVVRAAGAAQRPVDLDGSRFVERGPNRDVSVVVSVPPGRAFFDVELRDDGGAVVASSSATNTFASSGSPMTVAILHVCAAARCGVGETCLCGTCFPVECTEPGVAVTGCPELCCTAETPCAAPPAACAEARCLEGSCFWVAIDGACRAGTFCDPDLGCTSLTPPGDAGVTDAGAATDVGMLDAGGCGAGGCDDADACNGAELCAGGTCIAGTPMDCDDRVACTVDSCQAGACRHVPTDARCTLVAGGSCDAVRGCQYPVCDGTTCSADPAACEQVSCSGTTCIRETMCAVDEQCCAGACVALGCDDANPCTMDSCRPATGCRNAPVAGLGCDDGNACTDADACSTMAVCAGTPRDCNDDNVCTDDACTVSRGIATCAHAFRNGSRCDDGDPCTASDRCLGVACSGTAIDCSDGNACTVDACGMDGRCVHTMTCPPSVAPFWTSLPTQQCCGASCVDLNHDPMNCRECGRVCGLNEWCAPGTAGGSEPRCRCEGDSTNWGPACFGGTPNCCLGTGCVDLQTDANHCGVCGMRCTAGTPRCVAGRCVT